MVLLKVGAPVAYTGCLAPKKLSHNQIIQKIVLKPVNEIRFIRQIKVSIVH